MNKNNIILIFALLTLSHWAIASGCVPRAKWLTLREYNTHTVFVGKLLSAVDVPDGPFTVALKYQVVTNYRNTPVGDTITVYCSMCEWSAEEYRQKAIGLEGMIYATYDRGSYGLACPPILNMTKVEAYRQKLQDPNWPYPVSNIVIHSTLLVDEVKQRGNDTIQSYYPNGVLEAKGKLKNSMPDGKWEYYDENGRLLEVVNYKEGVRWGESKWYNYVGDTLTGYGNSIFDSGFFISSTSFRANGIKLGESRSIYIEVGSYKNPHTRITFMYSEISYDDNGNIMETIEQKLLDKVTKSMEVITTIFFKNGRIKEKRTKRRNPQIDGFYVAMVQLYTEDGILIREVVYDENGNEIIQSGK